MAQEEQNELEQDGSLEEAPQGEMDSGKDEGATDGSSGSGRGFAGMSQERRREIASKGGKAQGKDTNPANFANDREKAAAAGRIGGQSGRGSTAQDTESEE